MGAPVLINETWYKHGGPDIRNGQRVQLLIPGNTFHTARLLVAGFWVRVPSGLA
jgi:hypothetical protein